MLVEFFYPFDRGGSEISTFILAKQLSKKYEISVITPNFGTKNREKIGRVEIIRFPFYKKLKDKKAFFSPYFTNNLFWFIYSAIQIYRIVKKEKIDILHIQSKSFIVGACLANLALRKSVIITFRDYQSICNLGFCLLKKDKSCDLPEYLFSDIPYFLKNYTNGSQAVKLLFPVFALRSRIMDNLINFAAKSIKYKICISKRQREIFIINGFKDINVIHNTVDFKKIRIKKTNKIIYVGKLTPAKGILPIVKELLILKTINYKVQIIGKGVLENKIKNAIHKNFKKSKFEVIPYLKHDELLKQIASAKLLIVPSIWQEPFGRVAIEALSVSTPLVVSDKGDLSEIVRDKVYGRVVSSEPKNFVQTITEVYKKSKYFQEKIKNDYKKIYVKYNTEPAFKYMSLYKEIVNK